MHLCYVYSFCVMSRLCHYVSKVNSERSKNDLQHWAFVQTEQQSCSLTFHCLPLIHNDKWVTWMESCLIVIHCCIHLSFRFLNTKYICKTSNFNFKKYEPDVRMWVLVISILKHRDMIINKRSHEFLSLIID